MLSALPAGCSPPESAAAGPALAAPSGDTAAPAAQGKPRECDGRRRRPIPACWISSKYEGSDKARDKLNPAAERRYLKLTGDMREMEKGVNVVGRYSSTGDRRKWPAP